MRFRILLLMLSLVSICNAQEIIVQNIDVPYKEGESLTYVMNYKWGSINTDVGEAVTNLKFEDGVFHSIITGKTYKFYDVFFKVREHFESKFTDGEVRPKWFYRDSQEGKYRMRNTFNFNPDNSVQAIIQKYERSPKDTVLIGNGNTFDIVSLFYRVRNIDYDTVPKNVHRPISFAIDTDVYNFFYIYKGKEVKKIKGVGTFNTLVFSVKLVAGSVFTGKENMTIWVTDDRNKMPVLFESPVTVGVVSGRLKSYSNLIYPLTSKIK